MILYKLQYKVSARWPFWLLAEKSVDSRCSQMASLVASDVAMYSASIIESVM